MYVLPRSAWPTVWNFVFPVLEHVSRFRLPERLREATEREPPVVRSDVHLGIIRNFRIILADTWNALGMRSARSSA